MFMCIQYGEYLRQIENNMETVEFTSGLVHLMDTVGGISFPHDQVPGNGYPTDLVFNQERWDNYQWNPPGSNPRHFPEPDPNASPKPSWETVKKWVQEYEIRRPVREGAHRPKIGISLFTKILAEESHDHPDHETNIDVGKGIESMPAISYLIDQSNQAGNILPKMVLIDESNTNLELWTEGQVRHLLDGIAYRRNRAESARNIVRKNLVGMIEKINNADADLAERKKLSKMLSDLDYLHSYNSEKDRQKGISAARELFKDALKEVDDSFEQFPEDDLELARDVARGRVEAVSNAHVEHLKNAVTQQGMDLPESCVDQQTAVVKVGNLAQRYKLEIEMADTVERAKAIYLTAQEAVENVTVLNTPIYALINFNEIEADTVRLVADSAGKAKIIAKHPRTTPPIEGIISVRPIPVDVPSNGGVSTSLKRDESSFTHAEIEFTNTSSDDHFWQIVARNICGPSRILTIEVQPAPTE